MNKAEAIVFLKSAGVKMSVRTLQRHVSKGELAVAYVRGPKGDEADFEDEELRRFAERLTSKTYVTRANDNGAPVMPDTAGHGTALMPAGAERSLALVELLAAIEAARASISPATTISDLAHKLRLTVPEAVRYSGLARGEIERAIDAGKLPAEKRGSHGARVIRRTDLEVYEKKRKP
ncbi:MAG: helix-turn-helix domain-containing protein [Acidobacteriota bacterium]|nr:helix-turn-helix domain-containing protein [Acidobacteriota bacterium]